MAGDRDTPGVGLPVRGGNRSVQPVPFLTLLFEHAPRIERLVAALEALDADVQAVDVRQAVARGRLPGAPDAPLVNRVGAYPAAGGDPAIVLAVRDLLRRLEQDGRPVVNGHRSYALATSKIAQARLVDDVGLRAPRTVAVADPAELASAAERLTFPILFKPNVGGSGAGIRLLHHEGDLADTARRRALAFGPDGLAVLQEYHAPEDGAIVRVELLGDRLLYATRQRVVDGVFNYCAEEGCHADDDTIEAIPVAPETLEEAVRILRASGSDLGAVEYLVSRRDGLRYWFDINPFSNYVGAAVLGFDPAERLARYLLERV
ncbi:MAG: hypothetical protein PVF27_00060 [Gemmatimonadales bacterium]|jgi:glutathione synthase/RimK-type ligase-like ATP-grasp enzyme